MKNICIEELKTFTKYWGLIFPLLAPVHKGDLPQKFVDFLKFDKKTRFYIINDTHVLYYYESKEI